MNALFAYTYDWQLVTDRWHTFVWGAWTDVWITLISFVLACALGISVALFRLSALRVFRWPAFAYIQLIRSIPLLVFLYWVYFGLALVIGLDFTSSQAAIVALTITGSAYTAEIFRAGITAVDVGHGEAATALGFSRRATFRHVIFPQALRIAVPPLGNVLIGMLKGATLISLIGVADMVYQAQQLNLDYFRPFEPFTAVAVLLVAIVAVFSIAIALLERALRLP
jgi:His/Glu/Gln/Arg/opine family amino acid ABC transporter permease subunit